MATTEYSEGVKDNEDGTLSECQVDSVLIRTELRTVEAVMSRLKDGHIAMNKTPQRGPLWGEEKQSKLIESVSLRIPLPAFYLTEKMNGQMVVEDGLQRLVALRRFVNNEFQLKLRDTSDLNGKDFQGLPQKLQNRIETCGLILHLIDARVPPWAVRDIIKRVNAVDEN